MAANPPGECCGVGHLHAGTPKGTLKTFGGVETYISPSPSGSTSKVIFFLTDVIGHRFPNAQLLADAYASHGYHVVMPDLFHGDPWPLGGTPGVTIRDWMQKHMPPVVSPVVDAVLAAIREELKPEKVGAVGYCFGAKYVTQLLAADIDAGFTAHPSFVTLEELAAITRPLSIAAAETDTIFTTELRHESEAKLKAIGAMYQINLFSHVEHGFAVRGDVRKPWVKWAKEKAFAQALEWFKFHIG